MHCLNIKKGFVQALEDKDVMPATLAEELIQDLLKRKLDFNGMVITDASHMLGMTSAMRRRIMFQELLLQL